MSDNPLPPKKKKYVKERVKGKSKKDAALAAGYSESTARVVGSHIETPDVRAEFQRLMRAAVPPQKLVTRLQEGLDAEETKFFQKDGLVQDERNVVAWGERRAYAELVAHYGGYFVPKAELEVTKPLSEMTDEELRTRAQELLGGDGNTRISQPSA